jgi:Ca2+/H+ antiporter
MALALFVVFALLAGVPVGSVSAVIYIMVKFIYIRYCVTRHAENISHWLRCVFHI